MATNTPDDLLTRIQAEKGCSRFAARRILIDLIDSTKRRGMRISVGGGKSKTNKVFQPPIPATSTDRFIGIYGRKVGPEHNPQRKSRPEDIRGEITVVRHRNGKTYTRKVRKKNKGENQTVKFLDFTDQIVIPKKEFIITCYEHGMTAREITEIVLPWYPAKNHESQRERFHRVNCGVHVMIGAFKKLRDTP
jgi:hypothetical protein